MNAQFSLSFQGNNQVPRLKVKWFGIRNRIMAKHCTTPNIHTHLHHHRANLPPARINTNGNGQHTHKHLNPSQPTDSKVNCSDGKHTTCLPFSHPTPPPHCDPHFIPILFSYCFLCFFLPPPSRHNQAVRKYLCVRFRLWFHTKLCVQKVRPVSSAEPRGR